MAGVEKLVGLIDQYHRIRQILQVKYPQTTLIDLAHGIGIMTIGLKFAPGSRSVRTKCFDQGRIRGVGDIEEKDFSSSSQDGILSAGCSISPYIAVISACLIPLS